MAEVELEKEELHLNKAITLEIFRRTVARSSGLVPNLADQNKGPGEIVALSHFYEK